MDLELQTLYGEADIVACYKKQNKKKTVLVGTCGEDGGEQPWKDRRRPKKW